MTTASSGANPRNAYALEIAGHRYAVVNQTQRPDEFVQDFMGHAERLSKLGVGVPAVNVGIWHWQGPNEDAREEDTSGNDVWNPIFWAGYGKDGPGPIATRDIRIAPEKTGQYQLIEQGRRLCGLYHNGLGGYRSLTPDRRQWFLRYRKEIDGLWQVIDSRRLEGSGELNVINGIDSPRLCLAEVFRFIAVHHYSLKRSAQVFSLSEERAQERVNQMYETLAFVTLAAPKYRPLIETSFQLFYAHSMSAEWDEGGY